MTYVIAEACVEDWEKGGARGDPGSGATNEELESESGSLISGFWLGRPRERSGSGRTWPRLSAC
jgi:hypothetical protein